ncbi:MAG TPA: prepilin-type N-terminal cleavage/methylation domain-containing protein [Phycisphaerales bacterium]|nr:prepilin-type N-terminal cleavage/methylation domain-containing protein [Phycisphaerales bacterium]
MIYAIDKPARHAKPRRGFSILELTVVVAILALLSVTAIPALSTVRAATQEAGAHHVERLLLTARAQALATGRPWGVEVDFAGQRVRLLYMPTPGALPVPAPARGLASAEWTTLPAAYAGAAITAVTFADGISNASGIIWFDSDADPAVRASNGVRTGDATTDSELVFAGGRTITVDQRTGAVGRS